MQLRTARKSQANIKEKDIQIAPQIVEESEEIKNKKREVFWVSMTMYSMQISMEQKLKNRMEEVRKLSNVTTLMHSNYVPTRR